MSNVTSDPRVDALIAAGCAVAIGVSGGKDSQAAAIETIRYLEAARHTGPRILIHSDLGSVEWNGSLPACEDLSAKLGVPLVVVRRKAGGLMERWEARWASSIRRYEELSTVTLVPCWSTPGMRFCTSELKTHVITAELKRRFRGTPIINVTGVRRQESAQRAKATVADCDKEGRIWNWRPIIDLSVDQVFDVIDSMGMAPHPAYRDFGMSRVSCRFCIMSNIADLTAAAAQTEAHDLYRRMVRLESNSTFAFQDSRWLGDVAPHLLDSDLPGRLAKTKIGARPRVEAEKRLSSAMLFVKGWPTRMLTDAEADLLASVRRQISAMFGFESSCLDRASIHERYTALMAARP